MSKTVAVFGATGVLGGAVARALLKDPTYKVRVISRNKSSETARALEIQGAEIFQADMNDANCLNQSLEGIESCFFVTPTDFTLQMEIEIQLGKNVADACARSNIQHVIYSTSLPVQNTIGVPARNCDAKAETELYMRQLGLPMSCLIVPCTFEMFFNIFKPQNVAENNYTIGIPVGTVPIDWICAEDIGPVVHQMFIQKQRFLNKTVSVSAEKLTVREIADTLSKLLAPFAFSDRQITLDAFRSQKWPGSSDIANMLDLMSRVDRKHSITLTEELNPNLRRFKQWVLENKDSLAKFT